MLTLFECVDSLLKLLDAEESVAREWPEDFLRWDIAERREVEFADGSKEIVTPINVLDDYGKVLEKIWVRDERKLAEHLMINDPENAIRQVHFKRWLLAVHWMVVEGPQVAPQARMAVCPACRIPAPCEHLRALLALYGMEEEGVEGL